MRLNNLLVSPAEPSRVAEGCEGVKVVSQSLICDIYILFISLSVRKVSEWHLICVLQLDSSCWTELVPEENRTETPTYRWISIRTAAQETPEFK